MEAIQKLDIEIVLIADFTEGTCGIFNIKCFETFYWHMKRDTRKIFLNLILVNFLILVLLSAHIKRFSVSFMGDF